MDGCDRLRGVPSTTSLAPLTQDVTGYQRLVGRLLYITITRPDISFTVQVLSQFMQQPKRSHWEAAMRLVRYIKSNPGQGILLSSKKSLELEAFCDSEWAACPNTRRSVTGYMVKLGDSLISWKSKKQHTVGRSSAKANYRSMTNEVAEIIWLFNTLMLMSQFLLATVVLKETSSYDCNNEQQPLTGV
uniref:Reverse transcriptase Ty1/copia-type domain-containing protein n=1 Tax=Solanum lycopersicum TaxID=4081 RepID=A0A3Q7J9Y0_SOLLC